MKKITKTLVAVLAATWPSISAIAGELDLSAAGNTSGTVTGAVGGDAVFSDFFTQPAGTGVFLPFLTIERDANGDPKEIEQGYNTDGFSHLYLDQQRPQWNRLLKLNQLAQVQIGGSGPFYYAFELDANEPGADKSTISIDNVRIYTSPTDNTAFVGNDVSKLEVVSPLGTLRWAMNDPLKDASGNFVIDNWVKLDSTQENVDAGKSNGGSGKSDMVAYIPVSAFAGAAADDYVWFYNLNGVHYGVDGNLAAQAGYEEWRAVEGDPSVPDGGATVLLLGAALAGFGAVRRFGVKR
jgi:hypothetical protein